MITLDVVHPSGNAYPTRLRLRATLPSERRRAEAIGGAGKSGEYTTYPADPMIIDDLASLFGDSLELSAAARLFHTSQRERAEKVGHIAGMADIPSRVPRATSLYPYQRVGVEWLRAQDRAILGDQPGLGKTAQAIAAVHDLQNVLIVTLPAIKTHWMEEVRKWTGQNVAAASGSYRDRAALLASKPGWVIVNYEMLRQGKSEFKELFDRKWDAVIFDEAHKLQGRSSQQSAGAKRLQAARIYMLTGTPIWNKPESIWNLLHILFPSRYSSYWNWVAENCDTVQTPWSTEIVGIKASRLSRVQNVLSQLILRRYKLDVLDQLPPKIYKVLEYELEPKQRQIYRQIRREHTLVGPDGLAKVYPSTGAALADMRRLLNSPSLLGLSIASPKDQLLDGLLTELLDEPNRKVIVFTWLRSYADHLAGMWSLRHGTALVTGESSDAEREKSIRYFREFDSCRVLVATIGSVGIGIDLVEADTAIFAEGAYVPAMNLQAEDRLHRIGQKTTATIYRIQSPHTLESALWDIVERREELANEMLAMKRLASVIDQMEY